MKWDQFECVPQHWMWEERFISDRFEYIWRNIHLDCQPDPGNEKFDADVDENDDGSIVPEEEEEDDDKDEDDEEDLTEAEKKKEEREQRIKDTYVATASDDDDDGPVDIDT